MLMILFLVSTEIPKHVNFSQGGRACLNSMAHEVCEEHQPDCQKLTWNLQVH